MHRREMKLLGKYLIGLLSIGLNIKYLLYGNPSSCCTTTTTESASTPRNRYERVVGCLQREKLDKILNDYTKDLINLRLSLTSTADTKLIDEHFKTVQNLRLKTSPKKTAGNDNNNDKECNVSEIKMVAELRNRSATTNIEQSKQLFLEKMSRNQTAVHFVYSCGEQYLGTLNGYPLYKAGFVRKQCGETQIPTNRSTSLILDRPFLNFNVTKCGNIIIGTFKETLRFVAETFNEIHIVLRKRSNLQTINQFSRRWSNIFIHSVREGDNISNHLNRICRKLKSQFVVIATRTVLINTEFNLERMLHIHDEHKNNNKISRLVVASSVKNFQTGIWEPGCYQTAFKLYNLDYRSGYSESKNSCMKCDFAKGGAYLVATNMLRRQPYQFRHLTGGEETIYEDFFLRLTRDKHEVVVCPDSMVYSIPKVFYSHSEIKSFSNHWNISSLVWHTQQTFHFQQWCPTALKGLNNKCRVAKGVAVPPCCLSLLYEGVEFVSKLLDKHHIEYMLVEGTALGAVKFDGLLPWEQDADFAILSADFPKLESISSQFSLRNYTLVVDEKSVVVDPSISNRSNSQGGVAHIRVHHWSLQIFGYHSLIPQIGAQTKIKFKSSSNNNRYFLASVPENPANYCRNRYGHEVLKHAEHWMVTGQKSGWVAYNSGHFEKCALPGHNACLDQFDTDGNQFVRRRKQC